MVTRCKFHFFAAVGCRVIGTELTITLQPCYKKKTVNKYSKIVVLPKEAPVCARLHTPSQLASKKECLAHHSSPGYYLVSLAPNQRMGSACDWMSPPAFQTIASSLLKFFGPLALSLSLSLSFSTASSSMYRVPCFLLGGLHNRFDVAEFPYRVSESLLLVD